jgi:UDP-GlcNAc:undecaprenyl-phosphate GlcNAc-1-phosphate transferase
MGFPFTVYIAAAAGAFLVTLCSMPVWRRLCLATGLEDSPGHRKIHEHPVVLAGGLAIFTGLLVPILAASVLLSGWFNLPATLSPTNLEYGLATRGLQLLGIAAGAFGILVVGVIDDRFELKPGWKFLGQVVVALVVAAAGVRITLFVPSHGFSVVVTVIWLVTLINAFNFMDNMNGLCAGLGAIACWSFAWLSGSAGQYLVAAMAFLGFGAFLGFLPFNFPKAISFLGDAGSHLTGYLMAVLAILPHFHTPETPRRLLVLIPLLILAVPLVDMALVVTTRTWNRKPFYVGDTNHLSHRLVRAGLSRTTAVLVLWAAAAAAALLGTVLFVRN